jgi:hypothetical protein
MRGRMWSEVVGRLLASKDRCGAGKLGLRADKMAMLVSLAQRFAPLDATSCLPANASYALLRACLVGAATPQQSSGAPATAMPLP